MASNVCGLEEWNVTLEELLLLGDRKVYFSIASKPYPKERLLKLPPKERLLQMQAWRRKIYKQIKLVVRSKKNKMRGSVRDPFGLKSVVKARDFLSDPKTEAHQLYFYRKSGRSSQK